MFGYRGFGKARFAKGAGWTGVNFEIPSTTITYTVYPPTMTYFFPAIRITSFNAEVWSSGQSAARVTSFNAEVFRTLDNAKARVTSFNAEIFRTIEYAHAKVTTFGAEIWHNIIADSTDDSSVSILW